MIQPSEILRNGYEGFKELLKTTRMEIGLCACAGLLLGTTILCNHESERGKTIPLGFSEISQIEEDVRYSNNQVEPEEIEVMTNRGKRMITHIGHITRYLASGNDAVMKIFESWNESNEGDSSNMGRRFARELESHYDSLLNSHHYSLDNLLDDIPALADRALNKLDDFVHVKRGIEAVNKHFDMSWDENHIDHYRTEVYTDTETYTDSDGNTHSRTVLKTREVYDHTTHYYTYNPAEGEASSKLIDALLGKYPELKLSEKIMMAKKTNSGGEDAARKSRKERKDNPLNAQELIDIARAWNIGSTIRVNLPIVSSTYSGFPFRADQWRAAKNTARSEVYDTYSRFDSGPKEFQIAEQILAEGRSIDRGTFEVLDGIEYTRAMAPVLKEKVHQYAELINNGENGKAKKLRKEVMDISKTIYKKNFKGGLDVERVRWSMIALGGLLGAVAGGLVGWGLDGLGNAYWRRKEYNRF